MMKFESGRKFSGMLRAAAVMLCLCGLAAVAAHAQDEAPAPPPAGAQQGPPAGGRAAMADPDKMTARLTKVLDLTPDQQTQIKAILVAQQEKMKANPDMSRPDRRAAREDMEAKMNAVLTADQKAKYAEMQAKMRERRGAGGGEQGPPPSTPPPPPGV